VDDGSDLVHQFLSFDLELIAMIRFHGDLPPGRIAAGTCRVKTK
jgi:hypothetical protein